MKKFLNGQQVQDFSNVSGKVEIELGNEKTVMFNCTNLSHKELMNKVFEQTFEHEGFLTQVNVWENVLLLN